MIAIDTDVLSDSVNAAPATVARLNAIAAKLVFVPVVVAEEVVRGAW